MKKHSLICIFFILLSFLITSYASAYYDTFDNAPMNQEKWRWLEAIRSVSDGKLHINVRSCDDESAIWISATAHGTSFVKADISVDSDSYVPGNAYAHKRLGRFFYNDSRGPGSGQDYNGAEGEVRAEIYIILGEGGPLAIEAEIWRSDQPILGQHNTFYSQEFNMLAVFDTVYSLSVEFTGETFVFKCNEETLTYTVLGPIYASNSDNHQAIDSRVTIYDDTGECGYTKAQIDNFYNDNSQSPYDTFDGNHLDITKWIQGEIIREIVDGKLHLKVGRCNYRGSIGASPTATNESGYLEAKVAVNDGSVSQGNSGFARIGSYFYNEKRGPGSGLDYNGYQDNVFILNRIMLDENGILKAYAGAWRSDHPEEEYGTTLFWESFDLPIEFGKEYTLSIRFTSSEITYKCNSETIIYNIQTPTYESYDKNYYLNSRVFNGDQQCGFIDATFDDIAISIDSCDGDFDGDSDVDGSDLAVFAADFGRTNCATSPPCKGDFDSDGDVDGSDLAVFAADFGRTDCPTSD